MTPPNEKLAAVIFDLDGLMVNTEDLYEDCGQALLTRRGRQMTDAVRRQMIGRPPLKSLQLMIEAFLLEETAEELLNESNAIMTELVATRLQPLPGLLGLLDALDEAGLPRAVATSSSRAFAANVLERCHIAQRFAFVLTTSDVEHGKPAPDIYLAAARRLGVKPQQAMVLEDSAVGCQAAVGAGAYTVAIPNDHTRSHDFPEVALMADSLSDQRILAALGI